MISLKLTKLQPFHNVSHVMMKIWYTCHWCSPKTIYMLLWVSPSIDPISPLGTSFCLFLYAFLFVSRQDSRPPLTSLVAADDSCCSLERRRLFNATFQDRRSSEFVRQDSFSLEYSFKCHNSCLNSFLEAEADVTVCW